MKDKNLFVIMFMLCVLTIVLTIIVTIQGAQNLRIEEKVDKILEKQKLLIVTPTPQKDVE